jgi:hypothetical protein
MSQFHFHVTLRGDLFEDRDGCNYFDIESAMIYARRLAFNLGGTGNFTEANVLVVDGLGQEVARFPVAGAVMIPRGRYPSDPRWRARKAEPGPVCADVPPSGD